MQQYRSNSREERREHRRKVHRQRVRLIWQQESDDRRSQSLELAEWSAQQRVKCNSIPVRLSAWNTMCALVVYDECVVCISPRVQIMKFFLLQVMGGGLDDCMYTYIWRVGGGGSRLASVEWWVMEEEYGVVCVVT